MPDDSRPTLTPVQPPPSTAQRAPAELAPASAARIITIDLGRIASNWRALAACVEPAECAAVVKADAYGLGAAHVVPALSAAGCRTFFVATVSEAAQLRTIVPGATVYVLDGLPPGTRGPIAEMGARPVLGSLREIADWAELCAGRRGPLPAALHLDSGLNRLGLSLAEVAALADDPGPLDRFDVRLVMSHLASADDPGSPQNAAQRAAFLESSRMLPPSVAADESLAASDGLLLGRDYHFDLVRPGYALFGGQPHSTCSARVRQAVAMHVRVLQVRNVERGETVGYSATWTAKRPSRIAVLAMGYADGALRSASGSDDHAGGEVAFEGRRAPIVGRISMDLTTVDVTDLGDYAPKPGDLAERFGATISLEEAGRAAGTIGYELLTGLSRRAARVYVASDGVETGAETGTGDG
jgi:alanine racemase